MTTAAPTVRHVGYVMGMPISIALRGRHANDARGDAAWAATLTELRRVDGLFSLYRPDSVISRMDRGEIDLIDWTPDVTPARRRRQAPGGTDQRETPCPGLPPERRRPPGRWPSGPPRR